MIIDATKINYFHDPERSAYDYKSKTRFKAQRATRSAKDEVGVIIDASSTRTSKNKRKKDV